MKKIQDIFTIQNIFTIISLILLWYAYSNQEFPYLDIDKGNLFILSIMFSILSYLSIIDKLIKKLYRNFIVKLFVSLTVIFFLQICLSEASALINNIYPINPDLLPYTKIVIAGIIFFKKIYYYLLISFVFIALFYICGYCNKITDSSEPTIYRFLDVRILYLIQILSLGYFTYQFNNKYFYQELLEKKVPAIARK